MNPIRTFVVRIYRRDRRGMAGTVEEVESGRTTGFQSFAMLREVLSGPPRRARRAATDDSGKPCDPD